MATAVRRWMKLQTKMSHLTRLYPQIRCRALATSSQRLFRTSFPLLNSGEPEVTNEIQNSTTTADSSSAEVKLSDSCVKQIHKMNEPNSHLRVAVEGGGCSGFQYIFQLDSTVNQDDRVFEREGARIIVDSDSLEFLRGATIDYEEELIRCAFRVAANPKAEQGCSCGASFSLKL